MLQTSINTSVNATWHGVCLSEKLIDMKRTLFHSQGSY